MDGFLMRMGRHMNLEELTRYLGLLAPDHSGMLFVDHLARNFQQEVDAAVDAITSDEQSDLFRDLIDAKLEEVQELVDQTEEGVYLLLMNAAYNESGERAEMLFEKLREDMKALLPNGEVKKA